VGVIRPVLAVSVLITHSRPIFGVSLLNGDMAIVCFFMISGFLMALILETKYVGEVGAFYANRILRIYPPFLVATFFSAAVFYLYPNRHHNPVQAIIGAFDKQAWDALIVAGVTNLTLIGINLTRYINVLEPNYTLLFPNFSYPGQGFGGHNLLMVPQGWTLSLELCFYLLAPFVVKSRTWVIVAMAAFFVWWTGPMQDVVRANDWNTDLGAWFPFVVRYFFFGVIGFRVMRMLDAGIAQFPMLRIIPALSFVAAFALVVSGYWLTREVRLDLQYFYYLFAATIPGLFLFTKSLRFDAAIGEYSYPVYLFHYVFTTSANKWVPDEWIGVFTLITTLVASAAYIYLIDRRIMKFRASLLRRRKSGEPKRRFLLSRLLFLPSAQLPKVPPNGT